MKKTKKRTTKKRAQIKPEAFSKQLPKRNRDILSLIRAACESYPASQVIEKSYVLSRLWAWFSQIELSPTVHIPVPRFLTYRDP